MLNRRHLIAAAALLASPALRAQTWPDRPLRLVVPFPPGGLIDNMARLIAPRLQASLGQTVVVDNKPGVGGNLGAADVARAAPDGYTLLMAAAPVTISPAIRKTMPYKPEQLAPVALLGRVPNVLLVNPASGINSVADLVARERRRPGQMNYASNGFGTSLHLSAELLKAVSGSFVTHIPYRGAAAAVTALIAGEVDFAFENLPSALGQVQGGRVKALAVTTATRSRALPDVPTMQEQGMADFEVSAWYGVAAPAGLPAAVSERLQTALRQAVADAEVAAAMARVGADVGFLDASATARFWAADTAQWKRVAAFANISID